MGVPFYVGIVSNIGFLVWASAASICLFSAAVLRQEAGKREWYLFLLFSGFITSMLLLDDFLLLHVVVPNYLHIPEMLVYLGYGLLISLYLIRFRTMVLKTEFLLLLFAFGFFGLSIIIDAGLIDFYGQNLFEDGFKLFGIVSWATYFIKVCVTQMRSLRQQNHHY